MNNNALKIVNSLLGISLLGQMLTVFLPKLLPGLVATNFVFEIHEYNGYLFFGLALTHLFLNRWWIKGLFKSK